MEEIQLYRLHQEELKDALGYCYPVLSNHKKDNLTARYLQQTGNFIQTEMESHSLTTSDREERATGF